jgi:hypothetical protein
MATSKVKQAAKKYITFKNGVIAFLIICVLILLTTGWSIRNTKELVSPLEKQQKEWEKDTKQQKEINRINALKMDSIADALEKNNQQRAKQIIIIQQKKDDRVKEITKPDFSNDDIRRGFAN